LNCPHCTEAVLPDDRYCESCGRPVALPAAVAEASNPGAGAGTGSAADATDPHLFTQATDNGRVAVASHRGHHHPDNQDAVAFHAGDGIVVLAVADGVSTSVHARAAADTAVAVALECLCDGALMAQLPLTERLKLAVERAHAAVVLLPNDPPPRSQLAEPQATLVLALVEADEIGVAWVGDSRAYLINGPEVEPLTVDDSYLTEQLAAGVALEVAMKSPDAHCITQCLGMRDDQPEVHLTTRKMAAGALLLLCSDGFWNYAAQSHILQGLLCASASEPDLALPDRCSRLVAFANAKGGSDNITVALYRHELRS